MRQQTITGHVVADAEVKVSKNGKPYLEFRFANNEYGDEDGYTFWVRVSSYNPSLINLAKFYTKGKSLIITGKYKDRAYINKDGKPEVGRDITASAIEFNGETRQNNGENNEKPQGETSKPEGAIDNMVADASAAPKKGGKAKPKPKAVEVADESADDLPF